MMVFRFCVIVFSHCTLEAHFRGPSDEGTPLFRGPSDEGTPLFRGPSDEGTPLFRRHLLLLFHVTNDYPCNCPSNFGTPTTTYIVCQVK